MGLALVLCWGARGHAETCSVPSGPYPTIQAAVNHGSCTEIELAARVFEESVLIGRDLELRGTSQSTTTIAGQVTVQGNTTQSVIRDLTVDSTVQGVGGTFDVALQAVGGAVLRTFSVVVRNSRVDLFTILADGFESGGTSAWSSTVP